MARKRNRFGLQFEGIEEMAEKFEKLGGDLGSLATKALEVSRDQLADQLTADTSEAKLPRKGKYSTGRTKESITRRPVTHTGSVYTVGVGYDMTRSGMTSIYLMYGTPRMKKVAAIYRDIYGTKVVKERQELQKQIFADAIRERMEG